MPVNRPCRAMRGPLLALASISMSMILLACIQDVSASVSSLAPSSTAGPSPSPDPAPSTLPRPWGVTDRSHQ